jgi:hypothetical protein
MVGEGFFHLRDFTASTDVFIELDRPKFDAVVTRLSGDPDFLQKRGRFDG